MNGDSSEPASGGPGVAQAPVRQAQKTPLTANAAADGHIVQAEATFVPAQEILVGTNLLRAYRLEVDFPAQTVELMRRGS